MSSIFITEKKKKFICISLLNKDDLKWDDDTLFSPIEIRKNMSKVLHFNSMILSIFNESVANYHVNKNFMNSLIVDRPNNSFTYFQTV